jgi:hypothetical protein
MMLNLQAAWIGFLLGCVAGAATGLFFHDSRWLGGYSSWQRRMIRLAHVSFFGIGFLNLAFVLSVKALGLSDGLKAVSILLIVGAATMPTVCYLSAWKPVCRHLFFLPVASLSTGIGLFLWRVVQP